MDYKNELNLIAIRLGVDPDPRLEEGYGFPVFREHLGKVLGAICDRLDVLSKDKFKG